jgi:hypothetical protein
MNSQSRPLSSPSIPHSTIVLFGILLLGAVLRFSTVMQPLTDYAAWRQSSTAMMADNFYNRSWNILYPEVSWNGPGPSYQGREFQTITYISALLYVVVGQHDWVGRGVAICFGLWGIFALYQLISRIWDQKRALAGAAMMAILPGGIFIDRSFLPDPAMVSLVVTSAWMLVAYLQTAKSRYLWIAALIGVLGYLTKITGLIVAIPLFYAVAVHLQTLGSRSERTRELTRLLGVAVVVLIPVVSYYLWARHLSLTYPPYHFAGAGNWLWNNGLQKWLAKSYFIPSLWWNIETWMWGKAIVTFLLIGLISRPPKFARKINEWNNAPEVSAAPVETVKGTMVFSLVVVRRCDLLPHWCAGVSGQFVELSYSQSGGVSDGGSWIAAVHRICWRFDTPPQSLARGTRRTDNGGLVVYRALRPQTLEGDV